MVTEEGMSSNTQHIVDDNALLYSSPLLLLLRRLEKYEIILDQLARRGVIRQEELDIAHLRSTLNHADRLIRVRSKSKRPVDDLVTARETVQREISEIERRISGDV